MLFVTTVNNLAGRDCAVSNANLIRRSIPTRVKIATSVATSQGVPTCVLPPCPAYSPSVFSRQMTQSRSPGRTARVLGVVTPSKMTDGRTLTNCWNFWRMGRMRFQREMWSGTLGSPTAPKRMASEDRRESSHPSGAYDPVDLYRAPARKKDAGVRMSARSYSTRRRARRTHCHSPCCQTRA